MKNQDVKLETPLELMRKKDLWFQKVMKKGSLKSYLDAGKDCGYIVFKDDIEFQINDNETGDIVMNGMVLNAAHWLVVFSKNYWEDPNPINP
jgi:hypothetical protein